MAAPTTSVKPRFTPYETWGACARCNARVRYSTLCRERLTGLLVCGPASGRAVRFCLDPWPAVYDFQVYPDKSIEPPSEPLPLRYNLDDIWGSGNNPVSAPDDTTRLAALLTTVPYYAQLGKSAAFAGPQAPLSALLQTLNTFVPADYDGTFLPSSSVRTVTPPDEAAELNAVSSIDPDIPADKVWTPPWAATKGV